MASKKLGLDTGARWLANGHSTDALLRRFYYALLRFFHNNVMPSCHTARASPEQESCAAIRFRASRLLRVPQVSDANVLGEGECVELGESA